MITYSQMMIINSETLKSLKRPKDGRRKWQVEQLNLMTTLVMLKI